MISIKSKTITLVASSLFMAVILFYSTFFNIKACENIESLENSDTQIESRYIPCPVGPGRCQMFGAGFSYVFYKDANGNKVNVISGGATYQCRNCKTLVLSQYNAQKGYLGNYVIFPTFGDISVAGISAEVTQNDVGYNSNLADDPVFAGMTFQPMAR